MRRELHQWADSLYCHEVPEDQAGHNTQGGPAGCRCEPEILPLLNPFTGETLRLVRHARLMTEA